MTPKKTGITYKQFSCPLYYRKTTLQRYLICPANHPKFFSQKGCNFLLRLHPSWRSQIDSSSSDFATHYKKRTSVERLCGGCGIKDSIPPIATGNAANRGRSVGPDGASAAPGFCQLRPRS